MNREQFHDAIADYGEAGLPPSCYEPGRAGGWCRDISREFSDHLDALGHHDHSVEDVHRGGGEIHTVNKVKVAGVHHVVDWTGRQYDPDVEVPHVEPWHDFERRRYRYGSLSAWKDPQHEWCSDCGYRLDSPSHAHEHQVQHEAASGYNLSPGSGMIYLEVPPGAVEPHPGGVEDDQHITMVYLGKDLSDQDFAHAAQRASAAAARTPPLTGTLSGVGSFEPSESSDWKRPAFVPAYIPGSHELRRQLEDLSASQHKDWKPHLTLGYLEEGEPMPEPRPPVTVGFTHLCVKRGQDVVRFPFTG